LEKNIHSVINDDNDIIDINDNTVDEDNEIIKTMINLLCKKLIGNTEINTDYSLEDLKPHS
jgi:hypothetical protein